MKKVNCLMIVVVMMLISCEGTQIKHEHSYYLTNKTDKKLIHQIRCNKDYTDLDTLSFYSNGTSDKTVLEWIVIATFNSGRNETLSVISTNIYNITDTTSLGWSFLWGDDGIYTHFGKNINNTSFKDDDYYTFTGDYYLTVDDELLSLMKKDYTMLDKFKEYYSK